MPSTFRLIPNSTCYLPFERKSVSRQPASCANPQLSKIKKSKVKIDSNKVFCQTLPLGNFILTPDTIRDPYFELESMAKKQSNEFKFLATDNVGAADAMDDKVFLNECFVDAGYLQTLRDPDDIRSIIVGRTGSGKTALLLAVEKSADLASWVNPEELSLQFLSNSTILKFLEEQGVNLDLFYKLLWRHILLVELIRVRFNIKDKADSSNFTDKIRSAFTEKRKREALDYVNEWGDSFWCGTEERIREITTSFERKITGSIGGKAVGAKLDASGGESEANRLEVVNRAQEVVSGIQIGKLNLLFQMLGEKYFAESEKSCVLLIDRLDENWIEDRIRHNLIRALIDTVKEFSRSFKSAKVIISLRQDLLDRIFRDSRDSGYQEEKYSSFYLPIVWKQNQLKEVIDRRLNQLIKRRYSGKTISAGDVLGSRADGVSPIDFICTRSMMRPRDVIAYANCAIALSAQKGKINQSALKDSERDYSIGRWRSLADEWQSDFPRLADFVKLFRVMPSDFAVEEITEDSIGDVLLDIGITAETEPDILTQLLGKYCGAICTFEDLKARMFLIFFRLGIVGIKPSASDPMIWSFADRARRLVISDISSTTRISVHPMFRPVFGSRVQK